jgi:dTDP-4-dehydrorhamnose 3,5-epimerase
MEFIKTSLEGLYVIKHHVHSDDRGGFSRTFCKNEFNSIRFNKEFVQFNHSFNLKKGTLRGMHFQNMPFCEYKLIRCIEGSVFDVAVDIRKNSPTFLKHFSIELSSSNFFSILIPEGFAHGFQTLQDNTSLIYHHTQFFNNKSDAGLLYNDNALSINWPLPVINLSDKDKSYKNIDYNFKGIEL